MFAAVLYSLTLVRFIHSLYVVGSEAVTRFDYYQRNIEKNCFRESTVASFLLRAFLLGGDNDGIMAIY